MKNYSYITLLTNDSYVCGIILLLESMKKVNTKYPLHVLITEEVSPPTIEILNQLKVSYKLVEKIEMPKELMDYNMTINPNVAGTWRYCWTKFHIFNQTQFDKIIFLDADIMILKNIDHLFEKPDMTGAIDGEYFNLWPDWDHINAGCIVIEPSQEKFDNILNFAFSLKIEELPNYIIADQEVINLYYKDWPKWKECHLNKYYNIFPPYILPSMTEDIKQNCYFLHFVGRKPWVFWAKKESEQYDEYFYTQGKKYIEDAIKYLDWEKIYSKIILSVYSICKNEKEHLQKYLNSFKEADYICILDTGSTDGTWELLQKEAKKRKNLIIAQKEINPWRFDTARNESMKLIPKETTMFFMVDLDEIIKEPGWCQKIKNSWTPLFDRGVYLYHRNVNKETDEIIRTIEEFRVHSKEWSSWKNIVHEALINHQGTKYFLKETCTPLDIEVWHYPKEENKSILYAELCEQNLKETPEDDLMRLQLAIEYEVLEENEKALQHFIYLTKNATNLRDFELARCYFGIGRFFMIFKNSKMSLSYFREGRLVDPTFIDNYIVPAQIYLQNEMYQQTIELCKSAQLNCNYTNWCNVYDTETYMLSYLLGLAIYLSGNKIEGLGWLTIAQFKNSNEEEITDNIQQIINEIINKN